MSLIDLLLGKKEKKEMKLSKLKRKIKNSLSESEKSITTEAKGIRNKLSKKENSLENKLDELEHYEPEEEMEDSLKSMVNGSKEDYIRGIKNICRGDLNTIKALDSVKELKKDMKYRLERIKKLDEKHHRFLNMGYKRLHKEIKDDLNDMTDLVNQLHSITNKKGYQKKQELLNRIKKLENAKKQKKETKGDINEIEDKLGELKEKIEEKKDKIKKREKNLEKNEKRKKLEELRKKITDRKKEITKNIRYLDRPIRKLERSYSSSGLVVNNFSDVKENLNIIEDYADELKERIESGEIEVKDRKREKYMKRINDICNDKLSDEIKKIEDLEKEATKLENNVLKKKKKIQEMKSDLNRLKEKKCCVKTELNEKKSRLKNLDIPETGKIEELANDIYDEKIKINNINQ